MSAPTSAITATLVPQPPYRSTPCWTSRVRTALARSIRTGPLDAGGRDLVNCTKVAPLENKKKELSPGSASSINMPPLAGFLRAAFTLIELIGVLAAIALLAAAIVPTLIRQMD